MSEQVTDETVIGISSCFNGHRPIVVGDSIRLNDIDEPYRQRLLEYDNVVAERDELVRKYRKAIAILAMSSPAGDANPKMWHQRLLDYDKVVAERDELARKLKEAVEMLDKRQPIKNLDCACGEG